MNYVHQFVTESFDLILICSSLPCLFPDSKAGVSVGRCAGSRLPSCDHLWRCPVQSLSSCGALLQAAWSYTAPVHPRWCCSKFTSGHLPFFSFNMPFLWSSTSFSQENCMCGCVIPLQFGPLHSVFKGWPRMCWIFVCPKCIGFLTCTDAQPGVRITCWKSARLMIERLRVWVLAGAAGEFSSPELTLCADSYSGSVPPPCYRSDM